MSKHRMAIIVLFLLISAVVVVWAAASKTMSVQMKTSELRSTPSGLGSVVTGVKRGDRLTILEEKGDWTRVSTEKVIIGWIPTSSLTDRKIKIRAGGADARIAASSDEMSLATKGFTSEIEADFKKKNQDIDFTWVDKMIAMDVSTREMKSFLEKGGLKPGRGGAR